MFKRFLAYLLCLSLVVLPFQTAWAGGEEDDTVSKILVASGTVSQQNMKISATNGEGTASGGAFADFVATTVNDLTPVASGTVTAINTRIATVAAGALLELVGVDLSAHIGKKIRVRSNGLRIEGYIGAAGGEALDTNPFATFNFTSGWGTVGTTTIIDTDSFSCTDFGGVKKTSILTRYALYKSSFVGASTGTNPSIRDNQTDSIIFATLGGGNKYATSTVASGTIEVRATGGQTDVTSISVQRVTDLATTGAKIYSTSGGATQSWAYQDATFDPNYSGGVTYEIFSVTPLTNHQGHLLVVRDSAGRAIQGFTRSVGTGETSTELLLDPTFDDTSKWTTQDTGWLVAAGKAAAAAALAATRTAQLLSVQGKLLKSSVTCDSLTSGTWAIRRDGTASATFTDAATHTEYHTAVTAGATSTGITAISPLTATFPGMSVAQVLTPSTSGSTITSLKGGTLYNWSAKDAVFNYNDPSGYTYQLFKVLNAPIVATGSITAGNALMDTTVSNAFAAPVGVDLSPYQDGRYMIAFYQATGMAAGYISSTAPSGLAVGADVGNDFTAWTGSLPTGWSQYGVLDGNNYTEQNPAGNMHLVSDGTAIGIQKSVLTIGTLYRTTLDISAITGTFLAGDNIAGASTGKIYSSIGASQAGYFTCKNSTAVIKRNSAAVNATMDNWKLEPVTMPAATGALLLSTKGGSRGYLVKEAGFDPNAASTYKVLYLGDM
jgi:hypothetical protein